MSVLDHLETDLPVGWHLTHLIALDSGWQAIIGDDEHIVVATGYNIEEAIALAATKATEGIFNGRLYDGLRLAPSMPAPRITLADLGLAKPPPEFKRRV